MEIKHKITNEVLLTIEGDSLQGANLKGSNLQYANLKGADLKWANLKGSNLQYANLKGADLKWANLKGSNLQYANLQAANLQYANLRWADLRGADLRGANLRWADLPTDVIRIDGMLWDVTILYGHMRIGCHHHHVDEWESFTDDEISKMDSRALEFWQANKGKLITIANFTK